MKVLLVKPPGVEDVGFAKLSGDGCMPCGNTS
jgi:hypothetical protein